MHPFRLNQRLALALRSRRSSSHVTVSYSSRNREGNALVSISPLPFYPYNRADPEEIDPCRVKRNLNTHLAVSLVHLDPPSHHLQALRLLDGLLLELPREKRLWDAKARVLQAGEDYKKAVEAWDKVIALTPAMQEGDEDEVTSLASNEVLGERSWCLFNLGDEFFMDARKGLESVVQVLEKRKVKRDEEQRASEKKRSKEGIEKPEGVEEGEREEEKEERALAWWRLGSCVWELGGRHLFSFNIFYFWQLLM